MPHGSRVSAETWRGRRVFVTGHTGFKGSWLALRLSRAGARLFGYAADPDTRPHMFGAAGVAEAMAVSTIADIRDRETLAGAMRSADPEIVFHLAAQPLVRRSYREPVETWETNVMGTVSVLEAARACTDLRGVVVVTTDKVYDQSGHSHPFRESDALGGHDPYSASKAASELAAASYRDAYLRERSVSVATARAGNVIGGGDWAEERLLPDVVRAAFEGRELTIRYPDAIRPWQHVLDAVDGYVRLGAAMLGERGQAVARSWNFGPDARDAAPVREVVAAATAEFGVVPRIALSEAQFVEAPRLELDSSDARDSLGWSTRLRLPEAVAWTGSWYRTYYGGGDVAALSLRQIDDYEGLPHA